MKKTILLIYLILSMQFLFAQVHIGANFNYGHGSKVISSCFTSGYNFSLGYTIKRKIDINVKLENMNFTSGYFNYPMYRVLSIQPELRYYLLDIKQGTNPYVGIGTGYYIRTLLLWNNSLPSKEIGISPSIGCLFKLQAKKNQLYLNTQFLYSHQYSLIKGRSYYILHFNLGFLYYFKDKSVIAEKKNGSQ